MFSRIILLCFFVGTVFAQKCPFGTILNPNFKKDSNSTACLPFSCNKNEDCKQFGDGTQCLPGGECGCLSRSDIIVEKTQQCSNASIKCELNHCPDGSTCIKGNCLCNIGYFGVEIGGKLNCLMKNCTDQPDLCPTAFGEQTRCFQSLCQCSEMHYYDLTTHECVHQMNVPIGLGVLGAFIVVVIGPIILFSFLF